MILVQFRTRWRVTRYGRRCRWGDAKFRVIIAEIRGSGLRRAGAGRSISAWRVTMNVEDILKAKGREVATVMPDAKVSEAVQLLHRRGIGALVVSADGHRLDGILSERDIVHALADRGTAVLDLRVDELMTRRVVSCTPTDTIAELMGEMTRRRIRHLPVVDRGRLVGLVSIGDVVKNRLEEMEFETTSLRQFIAGAA